ncbi:hypothetical protein ACS0TY_028249 [Phlomoides rotata]
MEQIYHNSTVWSGLKVNFHKSDIMGINVGEDVIKEWCSILNCKSSSLPFKYLGMQVGDNLNLSACWDFLIKKIKVRLSRWENINLSLGGCIVLINSVLTNLPIYALSFHKIPKIILQKLSRIQRRFLWGGGKGKENKIAWVKWAYVCREWFNLALFGKWGWKALSEKERFVSQVLESKYGDFLECCERFLRGSYNPNYSKKCKTCGIEDEDTNHIFFDCTAAKSLQGTAKGLDHLEEFTALFENHLRKVGNLVWQCTIWFIWHRRNSIIFRGTAISDDTVFNNICTNSFLWLKIRNLLSSFASFSDWSREPESCIC